jgi:hypothetical protein
MPLDKGVTGYIENSAIDWAGLTNGLSKTVYDIGENREKRKQELEDQWTDINTQLASAEVPENQTLGDVFLNTTNAGTSKALEWNKQLKAGKISPEQYTKLMNNLKQNFEGFVGTAATFDKRYKEYMERQQTGKASALELDFASKFGKMAELNGKSSIIDMDGNIKLANIDPATGKVTDFYDMRTMNKPENIIDNKVVLGDEVEAYTKSWETTELWKELGRNGWKSIETARQTPGYELAKVNVVDALVNTSNPRKTLSILADNGGIQLNTYTTPEEKSKLIEAAKAKLIDQKKRAGEPVTLSPEELKQIDLNMVEMVRDPRNVFQPKLTNEQIEKARKIAGDAVDVSIGQKMQGAARSYYKPDASSNNGNGPDNSKEQNYDAYRYAFDTWNSGNVQEAASRYTAMTQGDMIFEPNIPLDKDGKPIPGAKARPGFRLTTKEGTPAGVITRFQDMSDYIYPGKSPAERQYNMQEGQQAYRDRNTFRANEIEPNKTKKTGGKLNSAQEANIRATMKANPGATRAQAIQSLGY